MDAIAREVVDAAQPGDQVLVMSNGRFGLMHEKLLAGLKVKQSA